ncbi:MAG: peptidylprolyl isomerase [Pontiellaceae bacterium]|nr:peptidylprolyl isomerase [Pontiellaceae bacterium]
MRITKTIVMSSVFALGVLVQAQETNPAPEKEAGKPAESSAEKDLFAATQAESDVFLRVNGKEITKTEVTQELMSLLTQLQQAVSSGMVSEEQASAYVAQARNQIIDQMIQKILLEKAVKDEAIKVESSEVDKELEAAKADLPEGMTLESILEMQGMTLDDAKKEIELQMAIQKLFEKKTEGVTPQKAYDMLVKPGTVTASHILIGFEPDASDEVKAEKKAELKKIRDDIIAEKISFADAAKQYSEDPGSKEEGGEYKDIAKDDMVSEFDAAIFSQKIDEVGEIIETSYGYHIIKVSSRKPAEKSFEEMTEEELDELVMKKKNRIMGEYVSGLLKKATIEEL